MARRRPGVPRTTGELLARARNRQALEQRWQDLIDEAMDLHGLEYTPEGWAALAAWHETLPTGLPSRVEQDRWMAQQRVLASWSTEVAS